MYTAAPTIKTFVFSGNITSTIYLPGSTSGNFPTSTTTFGTMNGETDISDPTDIKQSSTIILSGDLGDQAFGATIEAISLGPVYYVKLDNLSMGTSTAANPLTSIVAFLTGQWFKIDPTDKFTAAMESEKYGRGGSSDVVSTDGGINPNLYEQGTNLEL
jgi:hypothetical protein